MARRFRHGACVISNLATWTSRRYGCMMRRKTFGREEFILVAQPGSVYENMLCDDCAFTRNDRRGEHSFGHGPCLQIREHVQLNSIVSAHHYRGNLDNFSNWRRRCDVVECFFPISEESLLFISKILRGHSSLDVES